MKKYDGYIRKINYYETDKMAVVHHSNYARYLEESRIDYLRCMELPLELFEELGYMVPVVELNEKFKESAKFGDTIIIIPCLSMVNPVKFSFSYKIYNEDKTRLLHEATTTHCFIDKNYRPVSLKKENIELYNKMQKLKEGEMI